METSDSDADRTAESAIPDIPDIRPSRPERPAPSAETWPLEVRVFRPTFAALPTQVHEVEPGDREAAVAVRARWRSEYAFLYLGSQDDLDQLLASCDKLSELWAEDPSVHHREWLVDALYITQSTLIELLEAK